MDNSVRYHVQGGLLYFGAGVIGPKTELYVDAGDILGLEGAPGVKHMRMPLRVDLVWVIGERVIGMESKHASDLVTSQSCRRLARQMRALRGVVDVPCLFLRGLPMGGLDEFANYQLGTSNSPGLWDDLVRLQYLGVVLVPGPARDEDIPRWLKEYSPFLADTRNVLSALAGTDRKRAQAQGSGWFLRNIRGIGPVMAMRLHLRFGSTIAALKATDEEWRKVGVGPKIIERRKELML